MAQTFVEPKSNPAMISCSAIPRLSLTHTETGFGGTTFVQKKKGSNAFFVCRKLTL
jgi:hypothetical protein